MKMMHIRILIITLLLFAMAVNLPAQEEQPLPDDAEAAEEQESQEPGTELPASEDAAPGEPAQAAPLTESTEPGLDSFRPSEEISADRSVAFPNDI